MLVTSGRDFTPSGVHVLEDIVVMMLVTRESVQIVIAIRIGVKIMGWKERGIALVRSWDVIRHGVMLQLVRHMTLTSKVAGIMVYGLVIVDICRTLHLLLCCPVELASLARRHNRRKKWQDGSTSAWMICRSVAIQFR